MSSTIQPFFAPFPVPAPNPPAIQKLIKNLNLLPHIEGGHFVETDRAADLVPSPFPEKISSTVGLVPQRPGYIPGFRNSSTTIFYLLTPQGPQGGFHRNLGRTVHTLHRGRGTYVLIHADEEGENKRIETFIVGKNIEKGEKLQWIVEGGKYKASFLLPDEEGGHESNGLLISETVVPGFEFSDHDFLPAEGLEKLVGKNKADDLRWLLSPVATGKTS